MKKLNQKGFGAIEMLLILVIILIIAFIGWLAWGRERTGNKSSSETNTSKYNVYDPNGSFGLKSGPANAYMMVSDAYDAYTKSSHTPLSSMQSYLTDKLYQHILSSSGKADIDPFLCIRSDPAAIEGDKSRISINNPLSDSKSTIFDIAESFPEGYRLARYSVDLTSMQISNIECLPLPQKYQQVLQKQDAQTQNADSISNDVVPKSTTVTPPPSSVKSVNNNPDGTQTITIGP